MKKATFNVFRRHNGNELISVDGVIHKGIGYYKDAAGKHYAIDIPSGLGLLAYPTYSRADAIRQVEATDEKIKELKATREYQDYLDKYFEILKNYGTKHISEIGQ